MRALQATIFWRVVVDDTTTEDSVGAHVSTGISVENFYPGLRLAIGTQNPVGRVLCQFYPPIRVKLGYPFDLVCLVLLLSKVNQGALQCFIHLLSPYAYQVCNLESNHLDMGI